MQVSHMQRQQHVAPARAVQDDRAVVFRLSVLNVPSYLQQEEFRGQFSNCNGIRDAIVKKDANGCAAGSPNERLSEYPAAPASSGLPVITIWLLRS